MINPFVTIGVFAVMFPILFGAILYMLSKIIEIPSLMILSKEEIKEAILSSILIILLFYIFAPDGLNLIDLLFADIIKAFYDPSFTLTSSFNQLSREMINKFFLSLSVTETGMSKRLEQYSMLSSSSMEVSVGHGGSFGLNNKSSNKDSNIFWKIAGYATSTSMTFSPCQGFSSVRNDLNNLLNTLSILYTGIWGHIILLNFSQTITSIFLLTGLILRPFKPLRGFAAFLIAFSFALLIYAPTTYLFHRVIFDYLKTTYGVDVLNVNDVDSSLDSAGFVYSSASTSSLPFSSYCNGFSVIGDIKNTYTSLYQTSINPQGNVVFVILEAELLVLMLEGLAVLTIISISAGMSKLLGVEISPWILSNIARLRL